MRGLVLLSLFIVGAYCSCQDGVDNVIKVVDTTKGKGSVIFQDVEIWTYDKDKKPSCHGKGRPNFVLPGNFKFAKGKVQIREGVKEDPSSPLKLNFNVEKQSWLIGVVCENGKSKNQFVPNEICSIDFCKLAADTCAKIGSKTPMLDISMFVSNDFLDIGALPIPQLAGDWKLSAQVLNGKKVVAGIQLMEKDQWLSIETPEGDAAANIQYSDPKPKSEL